MDHVRTNPELGVMAHTCNPSTQEAEMGESPRSLRLAWITHQVPGQADPVSRNSHRQTERTKRAGEIVCLVKGMLLITRTLVQASQATKKCQECGCTLAPQFWGAETRESLWLSGGQPCLLRPVRNPASETKGMVSQELVASTQVHLHTHIHLPLIHTPKQN